MGAIQELASCHSHLLQVAADQARRVESLERRIDAEPWKARFATKDQQSQKGSRRNVSMRRFPREANGTPRAKAAVLQRVVADPPLPAATVMQQRSVADPLQPAPENNAALHAPPQ